LSRYGRSYELIHCTKKVVFESTLPSLSSASIIVTSVLANFICDAAALSPDRILDMANAELSSHVQTLVNFSMAHPDVQIAIVPPLARATPDWFNPYLPCFTTFLFGEVSKAGRSQVRYLSPFVSPPQFFINDGVHLNQDAGVQFIRFILDGVDQIFPPASTLSQTPAISASFLSGSQPIDHQTPSSVVPSVSSGASFSAPVLPSNFAVEFSRISSALGTLTGLTGSIRDEARVRREQDNLIFARLKEDRDFEFNKNREDRFTLTGFSAPGAPRDARERKEFYRQKLQELVDQACTDVQPRPEIRDVFVNLR